MATQKPVLKLAGADASTDITTLAVYAVAANGEVLSTSAVSKEGHFDIPEKALSEARRVVVARAAQGDEAPDLANGVAFTTRDLAHRLRTERELEIDQTRWRVLFPIRRCVDGTVYHCYPWWQLIAEMELMATLAMPAATLKQAAILEDRARIGTPIFPPRRCNIVCDGSVEVYRRVCCCQPWIYLDPRIQELIDELKRRIHLYPIPKPIPDPGPLATAMKATRPTPLIHESGALDEMTLNAASDLQALHALTPAEQVSYIEARPYLRCWKRCGTPYKTGGGLIQPDGTFHICWREPIYILRPFCHEEFAFKVTQIINGSPVVIYDGVAANQWFQESSGIELNSWSWQAKSCDGPPPVEVDGAAALLQDIGLTHAYDLKTPDANGAFSVALGSTPADFNQGLLDPGDEADRSKNLNLGGTLLLRYEFTDALQAVAKYYRVSVCAADSTGQPAGTRRYCDQSVSWYYYQYSTALGLQVLWQPLGPQTVGPNNGIFLIPWHADHEYGSGQYHASIDTTQFDNGRYLLTLELFDAAGKRISPNGTTLIDPAHDVHGGFTFNRWYQPSGPTQVVPQAALTHLLWWDNRYAVADIVDLRQDGHPSNAQCQFLSGPDATTFSSGYRAYHPEPLFLQGYSMWWRRGLGGPSGPLASGTTNAGALPGPVAVSTAVPFSDMLDPANHITACAFSVNLDAWSKTTNGIGRLGLDGHDQAAFAEEIT